MQTAQKQDIRSWAGLPSHDSRLTGQIYRPDKGGKTMAAMIRSVRPSSVIEVVDLVWLSGEGRSDRRRRQLVENMDTIEERGGRIREISTGDETPKHAKRMLMRAYEMIGNIHRRANGTKGGRPPIEWTQHELTTMEGAWHRRSNKTLDERRADMRKRMGKEPPGGTWLRQKFGSPVTATR